MTAKDFFILLDKIGFTDVILPFLLVFTVVYAILQKTQVLGPRKQVNASVALVLGLFVVFMVQAINIINIFIQYFVLVLLAAVLLAVVWFFLKPWKGERGKKQEPAKQEGKTPARGRKIRASDIPPGKEVEL